jgi:hypothetical protein
MKPFSITIKEPLGRGLAPNSNPRNRPYLVESIGAIPYEDALEALASFSAINTSSLTVVWPYPQMFVFSNAIVVCNKQDIYEVVGGSLVHEVGPVTAGVPWIALGFKDYIYLTNGQVAVTKTQGTYAIITTIPFGTAVCNYNGQVLIGGPNQPASGTI